MLTSVMREYYDYTEWANERVLVAAEKLTPALFTRSDLDGVWSIRDSLVHIMVSQWAWVERWNGRMIGAFPDVASFADVASIRDRWQPVYADMRKLLAAFDDDQLAADLTFRSRDGSEGRSLLWVQLMQVANHSTYHRGEVAALLTSFGHSPGELDFLIWRDAEKK